MTIKKTEEVITTTQEPKTNIYSVHPPIGQKPEGDVDLEGALDRLGETIQGLMKNMEKLQKNLDKATEENKRLKEALGIVESPLVLTEDMEVKDGHQ